MAAGTLQGSVPTSRRSSTAGPSHAAYGRASPFRLDVRNAPPDEATHNRCGQPPLRFIPDSDEVHGEPADADRRCNLNCTRLLAALSTHTHRMFVRHVAPSYRLGRKRRADLDAHHLATDRPVSWANFPSPAVQASLSSAHLQRAAHCRRRPRRATQIPARLAQERGDARSCGPRRWLPGVEY